MSVWGVVAELLLTASALGWLFFLWYFTIGDVIQGSQQEDAAAGIIQQWERTDSRGPDASEEPSEQGTALTPPVVAPPSPGEAYALLYVPRFGPNYVRTIAEGVDVATVLNSPTFGVGRYPRSSALGEIGNVAIAGHRTSFGASFGRIGDLRLGDRLYVEVEEGWYSYQFRNLEYVWPEQIDVLSAIPRMSDVDPRERILTLTSCHPRFSAAERVIAYAVYDQWFPRESGPPDEITHLIDRGA